MSCVTEERINMHVSQNNKTLGSGYSECIAGSLFDSLTRKYIVYVPYLDRFLSDV